MAKALDVIARSLRMIGATEAGETAAAEDADVALTALNAILHRFPGLSHTDYETTTDVAFADKHLGAVATMLAYEIAPEFGRPIPNVVAKEYPHAHSRFAAQYQYADFEASLELSVDKGLQNMPSQYQRANYRSRAY